MDGWIVDGWVKKRPDASDRCDGCGAQAYVVTRDHAGRDLLWCAHHYRKGEAKLVTISVRIWDWSYLLEDEG